MAIRIGISGWRYAPWRGVFYPPGLPQRQELEYASRLFPSIEINGSFYSLQAPSSWQQWHDQTPDHFVFAAAAADSGDVLCHFDNDVKVHAPFDAHALMRRLGAHVPVHMPDVRRRRNALPFEPRTDAAGLRPRKTTKERSPAPSPSTSR